MGQITGLTMMPKNGKLKQRYHIQGVQHFQWFSFSVFQCFLLLLNACTAAPAGVTSMPPSPTPVPSPTPTPLPPEFSGELALEHVAAQLAFGPRYPGTPGHDQVQEYIQTELAATGWEVEIQSGVQMGQPVENIIATLGSGEPWIIIGAHYDNRMLSDRDPDPAKQPTPVPGANDGASGVAVLLELARVLPRDLNGQVWLAFFDAEDNGGAAGSEWILGSSYMASHLPGQPAAMVLLDMIGDADLQLYYERNSTRTLAEEIWAQAAELGYGESFIPEVKHSIIDDHAPFLGIGVPAVDIIDFDYPYWHTTEDTLDKVSGESLEVVGRTVAVWVEKRLGQ